MYDDGRCYSHTFEPAENRCRNCGNGYCSECLVYAFGSDKPPYCISCALAASGVRSNAARRPAMSRREIRKYEKERKRAQKEQVATAAERVEIERQWSPAPEMAPSGEDDPFAWADQPNGGQRVPF